MKRSIAMLLALLLAFSSAALAEPSVSTEEWMIGETIELAKRIQALGADEAYGKLYTSDEQILSTGRTAAQMTIPDASGATVAYLNLDALLMNEAGVTLELSEEAEHALNAQFGSILLQMSVSSYGVYAVAGTSIYRAEEVYPGFDAFSNALVLLDCGTATVGAAFSMRDNGIVTADARLLPAGISAMLSAYGMPGTPVDSRALPAASGEEWYKAAALDAAARLKLLMSDALYVESMGASDESKTIIDGYAAGMDSDMEYILEMVLPSEGFMFEAAAMSEENRQLMRRRYASQAVTYLLARQGTASLSAGSMMSEALYYGDVSDFADRVVFVDAKTFIAGVAFSNMGKGVVRVEVMPLPADTLKDFSETDVLDIFGLAG